MTRPSFDEIAAASTRYSVRDVLLPGISICGAGRAVRSGGFDVIDREADGRAVERLTRIADAFARARLLNASAVALLFEEEP